MSVEDKYPFRYFLPIGCSLIKTIPIKNNSLVGLTLSILAVNPITSECLWKKLHKCYKRINQKIVEVEGMDDLEFGKVLNLYFFNAVFRNEIRIMVKNSDCHIILINGSVKVERLEWN